jgi:aminoglycoside/choline kinase family phosphotransferase
MLETVIPQLAEQLELALPGSRALSLTPLKGQLSTRRYYRAALAPRAGKPDSLIVMQLPDEDPNGLALEQAHAFGDIQRFIRSQGLRVPHIYGDYQTQLAQRLMLLEDLGDETFDARINSLSRRGWDDCYDVAIDNLARLHRAADAAPPSACIALRRHFEQKLLRWELDHFREWGLEALHQPLSAADRSELDACFDALTAAIVALPQGFVHRDYQSRNLMWAPDGALAIIDFQDAFIGPFAYDLVALLCDSYIAVDEQLQDEMLLRYAQQRSYDAAHEADLVRAFRLIAVQRKLKDAGRFIYIDRVRKIPNFVEYYPASLAYASRALSGLPELDRLRHCLERLVPGFPAN